MTNRISLYSVRAFFVIVSVAIGLYCASQTDAPDQTRWYFAGGALVIAAGVILVELFSTQTQASVLSSLVFGLIIGLVFSSLFQPVNGLILDLFGNGPEDAQTRDESLRLLQLVTTALFCYFGVTVLLHTHGRFKFIIPYVEFRREVKDHRPLLLDTSILVDGRIEALLASEILSCRVLVPRFVLEELHRLSDSGTKLKRERGRRGLAVLDSLRRAGKVELVAPEGRSGEVDAALLELAAELGGWVMSTDANLVTRGKVQDVHVVNLNDVAESLRMQAVPGERLTIDIIREGEEADQGVGFLPDGTMVVVEGGRAHIGAQLPVEVTGAIKTSAGRIIFARVEGRG